MNVTGMFSSFLRLLWIHVMHKTKKNVFVIKLLNIKFAHENCNVDTFIVTMGSYTEIRVSKEQFVEVQIFHIKMFMNLTCTVI